MKKRIIGILALICLFAVTVQVSKAAVSKIVVPEAVKTAFSQKYSGASSEKWGKENASEYEVEFTMNSTKMSANFKSDGTWVETESKIDISLAPEKVINAAKDQFPKYKVTAVYKIESASNGIKYEVEMKSGKKKKEVILKEDGTSGK
ncbi:hypothetical protein BH10BAC5_BH10BAC5_22030 [soil metagenome]